MRREHRTKVLWVMLLGSMALLAVVVPLLVMADAGQVNFTATLYWDVVRFEADGVTSLRVAIYDLSENELWSSGQVMGDFVDWDRTNRRGEKLANGYYLYLAQGWDSTDHLVLNRAGKVVLLPGDQVQLSAAPGVDPPVRRSEDPLLGEMSINTDGHIYLTGSPPHRIWMEDTGGSLRTIFSLETYATTKDRMKLGGGAFEEIKFSSSAADTVMLIAESGNLGLGTANPTDKLTIQGATGNLIACYPDNNRSAGAAVFRVEADGDVYADGTVYSASTAVGSADVAERINASEWVEAGDVVEIDPEHVGFFRRAKERYSTRVAGIISTSPGVILGNTVDPDQDAWDDNRPVLAIAGRVPVKVSAENGPIAVGDLLVSSSIPGVAMKGDPALSMGAVVGKAMEPLERGEDKIMAQVTLR